MFTAILKTLPQVLIFAPFVLGVSYSYLVAKKTDLTPEGSFVLGASTFAKVMMLCEGNYVLATLFAALAGALAGLMTSFVARTKLINDIFAGLLMVFMLYSINLLVLGKPNLSLFMFSIPPWLTFGFSQTVAAGVISLILLVTITFTMSGKVGLLCLAYGSNKKQLPNIGFSEKVVGAGTIMLSNLLAAFSGAQTAIANGYADINMGVGTAFLGITTCMIGQILFPRPKTFFNILLQSLCGLTLYFAILTIMVILQLPPQTFKLVIGLCFLLIFALKSYVQKIRSH